MSLTIYVPAGSTVEVRSGSVVVTTPSSQESPVPPETRPEETERKKSMREAVAYKPMLCPVDGCGAPLVDDLASRFMKVCEGDPRHVWRKEDLYYLRYQYTTMEKPASQP